MKLNYFTELNMTWPRIMNNYIVTGSDGSGLKFVSLKWQTVTLAFITFKKPVSDYYG